MQEGFGVMSKPKGSNRIRFAKRVVKTWLMYSQGYQVERIAYDIGVSQRMVYYYLKAWFSNKNYFIKIAKDAGIISLYDEASLPQEDVYREIFNPKILR